MRLRSSILGLLFGVFSANVASACMVFPAPDDWTDQATVHGPSCSFTQAALLHYENVYGGPVAALADDTSAQWINTYIACTTYEELVVVDCATRTGVVVRGRKNPFINDDFGTGKSYYVSRLFPPRGAIRLTRSSTVQSVRRVAEARRYEVLDFEQKLEEFAKRDVDLFCGCALGASADNTVPEE